MFVIFSRQQLLIAALLLLRLDWVVSNIQSLSWAVQANDCFPGLGSMPFVFLLSEQPNAKPRIIFLLWSSSWSLGRHHKHLCRNLCNCTCRRALFWTDPLPDKTLFSQAGFEACVCLKIASERYTHIFCYKLCTKCTVYRILVLQYVILRDCLIGIIIAIHGAVLCANTILGPKF